MTAVNKTIAAALAALTLAFAVAPTPVQAAHRRFHGGGIAGAIFGGLVLGAIAAVASERYRGCGWIRQPVVDSYGDVVGYRRVRYCG